MYRNHTHKLGILIPLVSILLTACQNKPKEAAAPAVANKLPVDIIVAQEKALDQREIFVGTIMPLREVAIVSETAQKITKVAFQDGSYVSQGAVLYTLNDADIKSKLRQVQAELQLARLNKDRMANLLKTETVKQSEYDEALMRFTSLEAQQDYLQTELAKTVIRAPFRQNRYFSGTSGSLCLTWYSTRQPSGPEQYKNQLYASRKIPAITNNRYSY